MRRCTWSCNPSGVRQRVSPHAPVGSYPAFSPLPWESARDPGRSFSVTRLSPREDLPVKKDGALCCPDFPPPAEAGSGRTSLLCLAAKIRKENGIGRNAGVIFSPGKCGGRESCRPSRAGPCRDRANAGAGQKAQGEEGAVKRSGSRPKQRHAYNAYSNRPGAKESMRATERPHSAPAGPLGPPGTAATA